MFGCYRKGDANDPETYVAALAAVLASYPEDVIKNVTHPVTGLPSRVDFLPTVAEVFRACEAGMEPRRREAARRALAARRRADSDAVRPNTPEQDARILEGLRQLSAMLAASGSRRA
jgi:hypothetical protein